MFKLALRVCANPTQSEEMVAAAGCDADASIAELLDCACGALANRGNMKFEIMIGSSSWPVDVRTDLSVFLEQMGALLQFLDVEEGTFTVSMYEQGIEANIVFNTSGDSARLHCEPLIQGTTTRFDTSTVLVAKSALISCAQQVRDAFVDGCKLVCPGLTSLPSFVEWSAATSGKVELSDAKPPLPAI